MGIEAILLCYIADEEMFPPEKRFAEGALQSALSSAQKQAASSKVLEVKSAGFFFYLRIVHGQKCVVKSVLYVNAVFYIASAAR